MTFKESIQSVYRTNYANFRGRASRSEYWWITLFNFLVLCGIVVLMAIAIEIAGQDGFNAVMVVYGLLFLFAIIPGAAVTIRRFHDTGRSGWWCLICFIPIIGGPILLFMMTMESDRDNKWGPGPRPQFNSNKFSHYQNIGQ